MKNVSSVDRARINRSAPSAAADAVDLGMIGHRLNDLYEDAAGVGANR